MGAGSGLLNSIETSRQIALEWNQVRHRIVLNRDWSLRQMLQISQFSAVRDWIIKLEEKSVLG